MVFSHPFPQNLWYGKWNSKTRNLPPLFPPKIRGRGKSPKTSPSSAALPRPPYGLDLLQAFLRTRTSQPDNLLAAVFVWSVPGSVWVCFWWNNPFQRFLVHVFKSLFNASCSVFLFCLVASNSFKWSSRALFNKGVPFVGCLSTRNPCLLHTKFGHWSSHPRKSRKDAPWQVNLEQEGKLLCDRWVTLGLARTLPKDVDSKVSWCFLLSTLSTTSCSSSR